MDALCVIDVLWLKKIVSLLFGGAKRVPKEG